MNPKDNKQLQDVDSSKDANSNTLKTFGYNQSLKVLIQSIPKISVNLSGLTNGLVQLHKALDAFAPTLEQLTKSFDAVFKKLATAIPGIDWKTLRKGYEKWGSFGWVIYDTFPYSSITDPPTSLKEANALARKYLSKTELESIFQELKISIPKQKDIDEAIWLFERKRYKSCAMMLFSLIDCELYKADIRQNGREERNDTKRTLKHLRLLEECNSIFALTAEGITKAYLFFFKPGDNFNRELEGEINRHFLMHGMMFRPVTQCVCIKLFVLLLSLSRLLHGRKKR